MSRYYSNSRDYNYDNRVADENEMRVKSHLDGLASEIAEVVDDGDTDEERYDQTMMICMLNLTAAVMQLSENVQKVVDSINARW